VQRAAYGNDIITANKAWRTDITAFNADTVKYKHVFKRTHACNEKAKLRAKLLTRYIERMNRRIFSSTEMAKSVEIEYRTAHLNKTKFQRNLKAMQKQRIEILGHQCDTVETQ
jgi:hypothetical protein